MARTLVSRLAQVLADLAVTGGGSVYDVTVTLLANDFGVTTDQAFLVPARAGNGLRGREGPSGPLAASAPVLVSQETALNSDGTSSTVELYEVEGGNGHYAFEEGPWRTITFRYSAKGPHWDDSAVPEPDEEFLLSIHEVDADTRNTNIGGGAGATRALADIHAWWMHDPTYDADTFREAVEDAIVAAIRAREKSIGASHFTQVVNTVDLTEQHPHENEQGTSVVGHHTVVTVRGFMHEVY